MREFAEALADGVLTRPVIVGPVTYLALAKATEDAPEGFAPHRPPRRPAARLRRAARATSPPRAPRGCSSTSPRWSPTPIAVPAEQLLAAVDRGVPRAGHRADPPERPAILVAAPYGDLGAALPVLAAHRRRGDRASTWSAATRPPSRVAGPGDQDARRAASIDGHNIWRADLDAKLGDPRAARGPGRRRGRRRHVHVAVPRAAHARRTSRTSTPTLKSWLAFADQKVVEVVTLAEGLTEGREAIHEQLLAAADAAPLARAPRPASSTPRSATASPPSTRTRSAAARSTSARPRRPPGSTCPPLPTTTIGSFPQTAEIRKARAAFGKGELDRRAVRRGDEGGDPPRRRAAGEDRPRRAGARRARAQRHGPVLRREPRRVRRDRRTAGSSPTARAARARRSCGATSSRPEPITVDVVGVHAVAHRASRSRACSPAR